MNWRVIVVVRGEIWVVVRGEIWVVVRWEIWVVVVVKGEIGMVGKLTESGDSERTPVKVRVCADGDISMVVYDGRLRRWWDLMIYLLRNDFDYFRRDPIPPLPNAPYCTIDKKRGEHQRRIKVPPTPNLPSNREHTRATNDIMDKCFLFCHTERTVGKGESHTLSSKIRSSEESIVKILLVN
uniref:Uncharacterized protein n=1 Tax=Tanacetum cinerariifolium TaxID=118510 RepID=A0A6L2P370_TANCI|nr:hypothetical protein [Tanacetum cinerariifolium]